MQWWGALLLVLTIAGGAVALGVGLIFNGLNDEEPLLIWGGALTLLVVMSFGLLLWPEAFPPKGVKTISLRDDRWECSAAHVSTTTTYVLTGKVMVPITTENRVCDQYNRRT